MSSEVYHQILELAEQLTDEELVKLLSGFQESLRQRSVSIGGRRYTREMILEEHQHLVKSGAFANVESLRGKYADPTIEVSDEELRAFRHEIGRQWEEDMDELFDQN